VNVLSSHLLPLDGAKRTTTAALTVAPTATISAATHLSTVIASVVNEKRYNRSPLFSVKTTLLHPFLVVDLNPLTFRPGKSQLNRLALALNIHD